MLQGITRRKVDIFDEGFKTSASPEPSTDRTDITESVTTINGDVDEITAMRTDDPDKLVMNHKTLLSVNDEIRQMFKFLQVKKSPGFHQAIERRTPGTK
jgi:hypothetical protein